MQAVAGTEGQGLGGAAVCILRMFFCLTVSLRAISWSRRLARRAPGQGWLFSMWEVAAWICTPMTREAGYLGSSPAPPLPSHVIWKFLFLHLMLLMFGA